MFFRQQTHHGVFQPRHVHIVGVGAEHLPELCQLFIAKLLRRGRIGGAGGDADLALPRLAVDGGGGVFPVKQGGGLAGDAALAAQHPQRLAVDGAVLLCQKPGTHLLRPHGLHFPGHAGHQRRGAAPVLEPRPRRGAVGVFQLAAAGGHHGLLAVVGGGTAVGAGKKVQNFLPLRLVKMQRVLKGGGNRLLGQVVLGGAKPAGKNQQIAAGLRLPHQLFQPGGIVPDDVLVQHTDAQLRQFPAQKLGVGVDDVPQQQLGAHTDDLCGHTNRLTQTPVPSGQGSFPHSRRPAPPAPTAPAWRPPLPEFPPAWGWSWDGAA